MDIVIEKSEGDIKRIASNIGRHEIFDDDDIESIFNNFGDNFYAFYKYIKENGDTINPFSEEGRSLIFDKLISQEMKDLMFYLDKPLYPDNEHGFPPVLVDYFESKGALLRHNRDMDMGC